MPRKSLVKRDLVFTNADHERIRATYDRLYHLSSADPETKRHLETSEMILVMLNDKPIDEIFEHESGNHLQILDLCARDAQTGVQSILSAILMQLSQRYIDHLSEKNVALLENFLNYLHKTGQELPLDFWHEPAAKTFFQSGATMMMSAFLQLPYWDNQDATMESIIGNHEDLGGVVIEWLRNRQTQQKRPYIVPEIKVPSTIEEIAALVKKCQSAGSLAALREPINLIERSADGLADNVLEHISVAFDLLPRTHWETREMANALRPGSYPYPVEIPYTDDKKTGFERFKEEALSHLFTIIGRHQPGWKIPVLDPQAQYRKASAGLRANIESLDRSVDSLYAIDLRGNASSVNLKKFSQAINAYLETEEGTALEQTDPIVFMTLQGGAERMGDTAAKIDISRSCAVGITRDIMPITKSLSQALTSSTVGMTLQVAQRVANYQTVVQNFDNASVQILEATKSIRVALIANAPILQEINAQSTTKLLASTQSVESDLLKLSEARAPKIASAQTQTLT